MIIYLIGMPSSGKSTFGRTVAEQLDFAFLDLDKMIEEKNDRSIPQIFRDKGEGFFRKEEQKALFDTLDLDKTVVATGGGTPCFFDNLEHMKERGVVCFLNIPLKVLLQRTYEAWQQQQDSRPHFKGAYDKTQLKEMIEKKWKKRKDFYQQAHFEITENNIEKFLIKYFTL